MSITKEELISLGFEVTSESGDSFFCVYIDSPAIQIFKNVTLAQAVSFLYNRARQDGIKEGELRRTVEFRKLLGL